LKVFVCFIKQACLLAISSIFWGVIIAFNGWASLNNKKQIKTKTVILKNIESVLNFVSQFSGFYGVPWWDARNKIKIKMQFSPSRKSKCFIATIKNMVEFFYLIE
jgi:hypothetical protein